MSSLFYEFVLRGVTLRNRIGVSPMCQDSAKDGAPGDWRLVHLGSRAGGRGSLVMAEAAAVKAQAHLTPRPRGPKSVHGSARGRRPGRGRR